MSQINITNTAGSNILAKKKQRIRISTTNIGSLPVIPQIGDKHEQLQQWIQSLQCDIAGLSEIGINWRKLPLYDQLQRRLKLQGHTSHAHNTTDAIAGRRQFGGVAIFRRSNIQSNTTNAGTDPRQLGRWCWIEITTKHKIIRIYQTYRCIRRNTTDGSVWRQQKDKLTASGITADPTDQHITDIIQDISSNINKGKSVILMGDINESIRDSPTNSQIEAIGMREVLIEQYQPTIATHIGNKSNHIIDGIWMTSDLSIESGGYTEYGPWDHRTLWIDIHHHEFHGTAPIRPKRSPRRVIHCQPKTVASYIEICSKMICSSKLPEKAQQLREQHKSLSPSCIKHKLEEIDTIRTEAMKSAEIKCKRNFTGQINYTPAVKLLGSKIYCLRLILKKRRKKKCGISRHRIERHCRLSEIDLNWRRTPISFISQQLQQLLSDWHRLKQQHINRREQFLQRQAKTAAELHDTTKSAAISRIQQREKTRLIFSTIQRNLKPKRIALDKVLIPNSSGTTTELTDELSIARACSKSNKDKYLQCYDSPLMTHRWIHRLGPYGYGPQAEPILSGHAPQDSSLPNGAAQLLQALRRPANFETTVDTITEENNRSEWQRVREYTESSPSGLHIGLWKANCLHDTLNTIDTILRNIPYEHGIVLNRWKHTVDVELQKEPGNFNINRLRTIVIVEADYNMNCKHLGSTLLRIMKQHENEPEWNAIEQYGSKKGKQASEVSLNTRLIDDIMRQTHSSGAICSNDAQSCYDRVAHPILSLSMQRLGIRPGPILSTLRTIQESRHSIRTAFGDSNWTYKSDNRPMQGLPQGNGMAPAGWAAISTPLLNVIRNASFGFQCQTAITNERIHLVSFTFVDDTDLIQVKIYRTVIAPEEQINQMVNLWNEALAATGGKLQGSKCFAQIIKFKSDGGNKWSYRRTKHNHTVILRGFQSHQDVPLTLLDTDETRKALGTFLRRDGRDNQTAAALKQKVQNWVGRVLQATWHPQHILIALRSTIWKAVEFVLPSSSLSARQSSDIMGAAMTAALPRFRINRFTSRIALHSPQRHHGLHLPSPFYIQSAVQLQMLCQHYASDSPTGQLLRASMEALHIEIGTGRQFWTIPINEWKLLATRCWITDLRERTHHQLPMLKVIIPSTPMLLREPDSFIMDEIHQIGVTGRRLQIINWCRLACQVMTVSDILQADGRSIHPNILHCTPREDVQLRFQWPQIKPPPKRYHQQWEDALWEILDDLPPPRHYTTDEYHPKLSHDLQQMKWKGQYYRRTSRHFVPSHREPFACYYLGTGSFDRFNRFQLHSHAPMLLPVEFPQEPLREIIAVTDGGWKDPIGTAGIILRSPATKQEWQLQCIIPEGTSGNSAYRCEMGGILRVIQWVSDHQVPTATIGCDNEAALNEFQHPPGINSKDWDIRTQIQAELAKHPIQITTKWIQSHQDDERDLSELSELAQMNVIADRLATEARQQAINPNQVPFLSFRREVPTMQNGSCSISNISRKHLYDLLFASKAKEYWMKKRNLTERAWQRTDWKALDAALNKLSHTDRINIFKIVTEISPTRYQRHRWKQCDTNQCVFCSQPDRSYHGSLCFHHQTKRITMTEWAHQRLKSIDTPPEVNESLCMILQNPSSTCTNMQSTIGALNFTLGYLDEHWKDQVSTDPIQQQFWSQQAIQIILHWTLAMYRHHVEQTQEEEQRISIIKAHEYVTHHWHHCSIPPSETSHHPTKSNTIPSMTDQQALQWKQTNIIYNQSNTEQ